MFNPQQDIYSQNWLDIIFDGRNKHYGAYALRRDAAKYANMATLIASSVFVVSLLVPSIHHRLFPLPAPPAFTPALDDGVVVILEPPLPLDPSIPEPPAAVPAKPRTNHVRMPQPVVVPANRITEEPPSVAMLQLANPGSQTLEGDPAAAIQLDLPVGKGKGDAAITENGNANDVPFVSVEIDPEFPGGIPAFMAYVQRNYHYPEAAVAAGVRGQVVLQFVVERDGSLTDIKIVRDLKFGTGEAAIRLLQASPKWRPGIQNGRPVRVAYTLPIALAIGQ